ncbi:MAG: methyltransferase domain-containing protein [Spirochaeta sp.]|nr:methyltransferase domain-containing protein [Spirochaeta sp.]
MTDFYRELSCYYDHLFPASPATVDFISRRVKAHSSILDLACGTGNYSLSMANLGCQVTGIDLDERMIDSARAKVRDQQCRFEVGDMRRLREVCAEDEYDLVLCIGNSLAHLTGKQDIIRLLGDCLAILKQGGKLIVQIVNFDRLLSNRTKNLPEIVRDTVGITFIRRYEYSAGPDNLINFVSELKIKRGNKEESLINSIPLLPLKSGELKSMVEGAGFGEIDLFGDFSETGYSSGSPAIVICGSKV